MTHELNRRSFAGAAATVAEAAALAPLLSACGDGGQQKTGTDPGFKSVGTPSW
jgi:putative aldouronate transport system substrate-binding protein